ncbi:MAG: glycosyltransferase family 2 protein [Bacteroidota bacterium]|nr:glycosyltransferase family 2 protein [Bacteroidota bacterium]
MKLSVIIVSYNVRHFLEQAISSALKALQNISGEILVVDNHSVDDSVHMIQSKFPSVKLFARKENLGFSKANNLAIKEAKGEFILLLNPDTLVPEDCFSKCLDFFEAHPDAGALGVKMIDGSGYLLPESKRGFPGLWVSFCKMSGLGKLVPRSKFFNGYYMGHLSYETVQEIEVLSGAFMMIRKKVLDLVGHLDERYFMFGEDIDLSYRIHLAGYHNYYLPDPVIVHYKGESTSKSSVNYVFHFYRAMILFAEKYIKGGKGILFILLLKLIIYSKAGMTLVKNFLSKFQWLILDAFFILSASFLIKKAWSLFYHHTPFYYQSKSWWTVTLIQLAVWLFSFYFHGVYEKRFKTKDLILATIMGFMVNVLIYALLPEYLRSSRMILLLTFVWILMYSLLSRIIYHRLKTDRWIVGLDRMNHILIIGDVLDENNIKEIYIKSKKAFFIEKRIASTDIPTNISAWKEIIRVNNITEIVFCLPTISWKEILHIMSQIEFDIQFKIMNEQSMSILGSSSKNERGELFTNTLGFNLNRIVFIRQKRLFDLMFSFFLVAFFWIIMFLQKNKRQFFRNIYNVIMNQFTWVAYSSAEAKKLLLPQLKPGILLPITHEECFGSDEIRDHAYTNYAWNYSVWMDVTICLKDISTLDQSGA